jgi:hypothetical protein
MPLTPTEPELIERCIGLELQAHQIYSSLAERFAVMVPAYEFLTELARREPGFFRRLLTEFSAINRQVAIKTVQLYRPDRGAFRASRAPLPRDTFR